MKEKSVWQEEVHLGEVLPAMYVAVAMAVCVFVPDPVTRAIYTVVGFPMAMSLGFQFAALLEERRRNRHAHALAALAEAQDAFHAWIAQTVATQRHHTQASQREKTRWN